MVEEKIIKTPSFGQEFDATSASVEDFVIGGCYVVPIYQRPYAWTKDQAGDFCDTLKEGFKEACSDSEALRKGLVYLGASIITLTPIEGIVVRPRLRTSDCPPGLNAAYIVIDGQQRISTLVVLLALLHDELQKRYEELRDGNDSRTEDVNKYIKDLFRGVDSVLLNRCFEISDNEDVNGGKDYWPRVISLAAEAGGNDRWGQTRAQGDYKTPVASFLNQYAEHLENKNSAEGNVGTFEWKIDSERAEAGRLAEVIKELKAHIVTQDKIWGIGGEEFFNGALSNPLLFSKDTAANFEKQFREGTLFPDTPLLRFAKFITFVKFVLKGVGITGIKVPDQQTGWQIFASLNTTGEPLTPIEIFKGDVQITLSDMGIEWHDSKLQREYDRITAYVALKKANAKTLLIHSSVMEGKTEKLSKDLVKQRRYLELVWKDPSNEELKDKEKFLTRLADLTDVHRAWVGRDIYFGEHELTSSAAFCFLALRSGNFELTMPILSNFYSAVKAKKIEKKELEDACRALLAFTALRRASYNSTQGLDDCYRAVAKKIKVDGEVSVEKLKNYLREELRNSRGANAKKDLHSRAGWIACSPKDFYRSAGTATARTILFAAFHKSMPDEDNCGLLKDSVSTEMDMLTRARWKDVSSVEHVHPIEPDGQKPDWPDLDDPATKDSLGNLALLPQATNSSISNGNHQFKRKCFEILAEEDPEKREKLEADWKENHEHYSIPTTYVTETWNILTRSLALVMNWDSELIERRRQNILGRAWDCLAPWLDLETEDLKSN